MEYPIPKRKIAKTLELMQTHYQNPGKIKDLQLDLPTFLLFYLSGPVRVEDTNTLFQYLDNYLQQNPLKFLISLSSYFIHGLTKDKPKILSLFKSHYFSNPEILKPAIFALVLSTLRAIADSTEISAPAIEMLDNASRSFRVHECTWKIVLISTKTKLAALSYLTYRLVVDNKQRALHALLSCLDDTNVNVRKSALGLIKRIFPFDNNEVQREVKTAILVRVLELFVQNDRILVSKVLEWVQTTADGGIHEDGIEILAEAIVKISAGFKQDEIMSVHNNFLMDLVDYEKIIRKVFVPLAINYCRKEGNLPDFFKKLLMKNHSTFWVEYKVMFLKSFKDLGDQKELFELADQLIEPHKDQQIVEFIVKTLLQHANEDPEKYLNFAIHLLQYIKKINMTLREVKEFVYNSEAEWKLVVNLLIRLFHLSVDCEDLISNICSENIINDEDRINYIWFTLKRIPEEVTKDDVVFVFEHSLATNQTELLSSIIRSIPRKVKKELKILLSNEPELGLQCLILSNPFGLKYSATLFNDIGKNFADEDYTINFLLIKWLNQILQEKIDIFSSLVKPLEATIRKSETKSKNIIKNLKFIIQAGGWPVLKLMQQLTQHKIFSKLEQFLIRPPFNNSFRYEVCELSSVIILNSPSEFSATLVDIGLEILVKAIDVEEVRLLLILIDFFDNLLLALAGEAEFEIISRGLVNILDPLTRLIAYYDILVRNAWLDFIKRLVPFMLKYLDSSTTLNYLNNVLRTYFAILKGAKDFRVMEALEVITMQLLSFPYFSDENLSKTSKKLLFFFLQKYLDLTFTEDEEQILVTKKIIKGIFEDNPQKFIKKIVSVWVEDCLYNPDTWNVLQKYIEIVEELGIDLFEVFQRIRMILEKKIESNPENDEKILTISCVTCKFQERLKTVNQTIWSEAILIYKKLFSVKLPEICFFVSYSLIQLRSQVTWAGLAKDEQIILKQIVATCISCTLEFSASSLIPHKLPYPDIVSSNLTEVSGLYFGLINSYFHQIVDIGSQ